LAASDLEEELWEIVHGARFLAHDELTADVLENWQQHAEMAGERGEGSKLGNKLTNPARFCGIDFFADDPDTRKLLVHNKEIGAACTRCYSSFLDLAAKLIDARAESGVTLEEALNFTLGVRLQYSGMTIAEIADEFHAMLRAAQYF
jgi:hypothetical protein